MRQASLALALAVMAAPLGRADGPQGVNFSAIAPVTAATSATDRVALFRARAQAVEQTLASYPLGPFAFSNNGFAELATARLALGQDVDLVNQTLLDPSTVVYSDVGSDIHYVVCNRNGDYDFSLVNLVRLTYLYGDNPALVYPATRAKILGTLLSQKGNQPHLQNSLGICGTHDESENHILMTESSRYLTNQLLERDLRAKGAYDPAFDNAANGMKQWMLGHLQIFIAGDFKEYNSRPYQGYSVKALENLYDFAEDADVKTAAQMVLDYLGAKFAISSAGARREPPFRRSADWAHRTDFLNVDDETGRMLMLVGDTRVLAQTPYPGWAPGGLDFMIFAATSAYRLPPLELDLILSPQPFFEHVNHTGVEIYAGSPSFLISGGGIYLDDFGWDFGTQADAGWSMPTSLIPMAGGPSDAADFIRINGGYRDAFRTNTCVAPGFACGVNVQIPDAIPESCREYRGRWTFLDFTSVKCPLKYGFYAAVHWDPCDTLDCSFDADTYGFFEAAEPGAMTYAVFRDGVLARNGATKFKTDAYNVYATAGGRRIEFSFLPPGASTDDNKYDSPIAAIDGVSQQQDIHQWPLATGDILQANGKGLAVVLNPAQRRELVLDDRDAQHPKRYEKSY